MATAGTQARRWWRAKRRSAATGACRCCHTAAASTAAPITGTMNRKLACPWMRNHPVSAKIQASRTCPAATDAAAIRKTQYMTTYRYGIQSELIAGGCTAPKTRMTAKHAAAARSDRVQPYTMVTTRASRALLSTKTASRCAFQAAGTTCRPYWNSHWPKAWTYMYAGPGWLNPSRE